MTSSRESREAASGPEKNSHGAGLALLAHDLPDWCGRFGELYLSGTTVMFVLHGNTFDFVPMPPANSAGQTSYVTLTEFLAERLFASWDLVLHYDLARGLRCLAGRSEKRLRAMIELANTRVGDVSSMRKDPASILATIGRFVERNTMADDEDRLRAAVILDHASYVVPRGEVGQSLFTSTHLVTLLNWASSPYVKRHNMAFVLIDRNLADISERLTSNAHVASIEIELPEETERALFLRHIVGERDVSQLSDYGIEELAGLTAGVSLTDLNVLIRSTLQGGRRLDAKVFRQRKKQLIERQAQGLLEFIEPRWNLDMVVGHDAAKDRLREDAALLARGALQSVPMGYLLCGPVGTGKSFLAQCTAGAIGIPCVKLKNFRSKYVGETEANLERVLAVLRRMGPVMVIVDEADAMLGDRDQSGDSGVGSRVFGMIAAQMGDTRYRGQILWMLLTARPDLLPIDLKRQGRAEIHIPLFYPSDEQEVRELFLVLARKLGASLQEHDVPPIPHLGDLSGADIEGIISRAWRMSLLTGKDHIGREQLETAVGDFMPSTRTLERKLQEMAAIIECTDRVFLPASVAARVEEAGGREKLQERLNGLKRLVDAR
ncbi:MAG: ATP-binding protein [Acidobacteriota bacterium]|nr:MAG: ATP-binding protein [Acidobacteriota bacterium]